MRRYHLTAIQTLFSRRISANRKTFSPAILFLAAFGATTAYAGSFTYTYTGLDFTDVFNNLAGGDPNPLSDSDYITATITLSSPLANNQAEGTNEIGALTSWEISDQTTTYYSTNPDSTDLDLDLGTTNGTITSWIFQIEETTSTQDAYMETLQSKSVGDGSDDSTHPNESYGMNTDDPGTWTLVNASATPEPKTSVSILLGWAVLTLAMRRKRRARLPI